MIVTVDSKHSKVLLEFLLETKLLNLPKKVSSCFSTLRIDLRRGNINSDRFAHAMPMISYAHSSFHTLVARHFSWRRIARWKRLLFLPALVEYLLFMKPQHVKARKRLNEVAVVVKNINKMCGG